MTIAPTKRRAWVQYMLNLQGSSMAQVAEAAGVTRQCLYHVFSKPYPRMERVLASALGLTAQELFPERYDSDGLPLRKRIAACGGTCHDNKNNSLDDAITGSCSRSVELESNRQGEAA